MSAPSVDALKGHKNLKCYWSDWGLIAIKLAAGAESVLPDGIDKDGDQHILEGRVTSPYGQSDGSIKILSRLTGKGQFGLKVTDVEYITIDGRLVFVNENLFK